jgi:Sensors of blue-light using FAD
MSLQQLIYASAAAKPFTPPELRALLAVARANNTPIEVSGLLLYHQGSFFQVLEGEKETVDAVFKKIGKDPRHTSVLLVSSKEIEKRSFGEWSMGFADVARMAAGVPGFMELFNATSSFLDLQKGDAKLVGKLVDGFQDGLWRQHVG